MSENSLVMVAPLATRTRHTAGFVPARTVTMTLTNAVGRMALNRCRKLRSILAPPCAIAGAGANPRRRPAIATSGHFFRGTRRGVGVVTLTYPSKSGASDDLRWK